MGSVCELAELFLSLKGGCTFHCIQVHWLGTQDLCKFLLGDKCLFKKPLPAAS